MPFTSDLDDDLFDVQSELIPVTAKWRSIGTALRLKSDVLESIQAASGSDPPACLVSMVTEWLRRNYNVKRFGEPTWQRLVEAVGHPAGGANMAVARDIARRHKAGGVSGGLCMVTVYTLNPSDVGCVTAVQQVPMTQQTPPRPQRRPETHMMSKWVIVASKFSCTFMNISCLPAGPPSPSSTIYNHPSPPPSLEPAVVTYSPPYLLPQQHSGNMVASCLVEYHFHP